MSRRHRHDTASSMINLSDVLPAGTVVAGRYEVLEHLADGGMARVYVALQRPLQRRVALKVLKPLFVDRKDTVERFVREAVAVSQLRHPNTITVFDFGELAEGNYFIAMELLDGEPLSARISRQGALAPSEAATITAQVAGSLAEAHSLGIIHRDLKPENIFLDNVKANFVKVLDFGVAKFMLQDTSFKKLTQMGIMPGTPEYMSPEQCRGATDFDARSDLYSLGALLYEMLAGDPPFFGGPTPVAVMLKHVSENPPPLPQTVPPPLAEFVIRRGLAKNPDDRPSDAQAFAAELEGAMRDAGIENVTNMFDLSDVRARFASGALGTSPLTGSTRTAAPGSPPHAAPPQARPAAAKTGSRSTQQGPLSDDDLDDLFGVTSLAPDEEDESPTVTDIVHPDALDLGPEATTPDMPAMRPGGQIFLEFAQPALDNLGDDPSDKRIMHALSFAKTVWNAAVRGASYVEGVRKWVADNGSPTLREVYLRLLDSRRERFSQYFWLVDEVSIHGRGPDRAFEVVLRYPTDTA